MKCPNCKLSFKNSHLSNTKSKTPKGLFFFLVLVVASIFYIVQSAKTNQQRVYEEKSKWYENGNLHNKKIVDWRSATYNNKLATCADFIARTYSEQFVDIEEVKPYAKELVICIDETIKADVQNMEQEKIAGLSILCLITMQSQ